MKIRFVYAGDGDGEGKARDFVTRASELGVPPIRLEAYSLRDGRHVVEAEVTHSHRDMMKGLAPTYGFRRLGSDEKAVPVRAKGKTARKAPAVDPAAHVGTVFRYHGEQGGKSR